MEKSLWEADNRSGIRLIPRLSRSPGPYPERRKSGPQLHILIITHPF